MTRKKELTNSIINIVRNNLDAPHYKLFIFGSRVNGKADQHSDIDIGIEGPRAIPGAVMERIRGELDELPYLQQFDVVDFATVNDSFKKIAITSREIIYER